MILKSVANLTFVMASINMYIYKELLKVTGFPEIIFCCSRIVEINILHYITMGAN